MKLGIIILNFNNSKETIDCLKSLDLEILQNLEIIKVVVDNNSQQDDLSKLKGFITKEILIENKRNQGFSEGNNTGIKIALAKGADHILLLNNDTLIPRNFFNSLVKFINDHCGINIFSPKIYFVPGYEFHKNRYKEFEKGKVIWYAGGVIDWKNILPSHRGVDEVDNNQYNYTEETSFATGCCMLINKKVFENIGFFDKKYFLYWEDIDFCERAKIKGLKIFYTGKIFLYHKNASSSGGPGSNISVYYQTRNRLLFTYRYGSLKAKLAVFKHAIKQYFSTKNQWEKRGIKDFFTLHFDKLKT